MTNSLFRKASRQNTKLRLSLIGPPGAGKTLTALRIARGMGCKKIAVIDTENGSSELYAGMVLDDCAELGELNFDVAIMSAPFTVDKYIRATNAAASEGYDCVIIDSASHAWAGEGGILQQKERMDARGGSSFNNWGKLTPEQEKFKNMVLHNKTHLIVTMRTKTAYVIEENEKGKSAPRKVGLAPIQRDGFEYEFDLVLNIAEDHHFMASKDRTNMFGDHIFKGDETIGAQLKDWLESGSAAIAREEEAEQTKEETQPCQNTQQQNAQPVANQETSDSPKTSDQKAPPKASKSVSGANAKSSATSSSKTRRSNSSTQSGENPNGKSGSTNSSQETTQEDIADDTLGPGQDPASMKPNADFELPFNLGNYKKGTKLKDIKEIEKVRDKLYATIGGKSEAGHPIPETWDQTIDKMDEFLGYKK